MNEQDLPIGEDARPTSRPMAEAGPERHPARSRILLAHAQPVTREYFAALLQDYGCDVATCKDGWEALSKLGGARFDLLVAAIQMPRMDGLELIRAVHEQFPALPVIALSPSFFEIDDVYLRNARLLGAVEGFTQPVRPEVFLEGVARCLQTNLNGR